METTKYILMLLLCASILMAGCRSKDTLPQKPQNEMDERVANILKLSSLSAYILFDTCSTVYLLQTTTCNACSKSGLENIRKAERNKNGRVIFVLSGHKQEIDSFLLDGFDPGRTILLYDNAGEMPQLGLNFYRDMQIQICHDKVNGWKFIN
jgi:hypothetical protein